MSDVSRRTFMVGTAGVAGLLSLPAITACASSSSPSGADATLVIGLNSDVNSLDPNRALGWTTMLVTQAMGEHLVTEDLSASPASGPPLLVPRLAESYEISPDGLTYTYHLRPGVRFHDGTPFDAAAVEFNIRRQWDKSFDFYFPVAAQTSFWDYQFLKGISTSDTHTVQLTLTQPWPEFIRMNVQSWGQQFMVSPTWIRKAGNNYVGDAPKMTGPYRFKSRTPGSQIVVERNPDYWGPKPAAEKIIFLVQPDDATRVSSIASGTIDIAQDPIPWSSKSQIEGASAKVTTAHSPYLIFMSLNLHDPVMKIQEVRQAVEFAIDKVSMAKSLYGSWATAAASMLPENSPSYDPTFRGRPYDPRQAKSLLAKAGFPNGFSTHMLIDTTYEDFAQWIQRDLAQVGIKVVLDVVDFVTFGGKWGAGLVSPETMTFAGWGMTADYWIDIMTRSTRQPPNGTNVAWYANPAVDKLLDAAEVELDTTKRHAYYRQVADILYVDVPHVPLVNFEQPVGVLDAVSGLVRPNEDWWTVATVKV